MKINSSHTCYSIINSRFDTTVIENPFYETSSVRDSLIEQMKNNVLIIDEKINEEDDTKKPDPQLDSE